MTDKEPLPMKELHDKVFRLYEEIQSAVAMMRRVVDTMKPGDLADSGYFLRECEALMDDGRKELKARREYINKLVCRIGLESFSAGGDLDIPGQYCKAFPDIKQQPNIPRPGSPEYAVLMKGFGVDPEIAESGIFKVDFNKMTDRLTKLASEGKNPPDGLLGTFPLHSVIYRKKR